MQNKLQEASNNIRDIRDKREGDHQYFMSVGKSTFIGTFVG